MKTYQLTIYSKRTLTLCLMSLLFLSRGLAQGSPQIVRTMSWNMDGTMLAVGYQFGPLEIIDPQSGQLLYSDPSFQLINSVAWSPVSKNYLAVAGNLTDNQSTVEIIDVSSRTVIGSFDGGESSLSVAWSSDGIMLAFSSNPLANSPTERSEVRIWNLQTGKSVLTLSPLSGNSINTIDWKPNGLQLAAGTSDYSVVIWDINTGGVTQVLQQGDAILSVDWSPNGKSLVSTSSNRENKLTIWDTTSWEVVTTFTSNSGTVKWSPDGTEVAVGEYLAVKVFDVNSGKEIIAIPTNRLERALSYSPFGGQLAFGGEISPYANSNFSTDINYPTKAIANGTVQIIVPIATLDRFAEIAASCGAPAALTSFDSSMQAESAIDAQAQTLIGQLDALPDNSIPAGCAADLRAIAEAIGARSGR